MPAPAVYALAVVGTVGAAFAFHQFVYEPHIAPRLELWAEEFIKRRRARRMEQQGLILVPTSIPLRRRDGHENHSDSSDSESNSDPDMKENSSQSRDSRQPSDSVTSAHVTDFDFDSNVAREVGEWRSKVGQSQLSSNLRHRTNRGAHAMDESINPISYPIISPTHVISDASGSTTPTTTTVPSIISSPPVQVSPLSTPATIHSSSNQRPVSLGPSSLSPVRTPLPPSPSHPSPAADATRTSPVFHNATSSILDTYSPPSFSSPIPSLSQSYPQELDRERDVELLSHPSSETPSPFTTFSPFVAAPQAFPPLTVDQPLNQFSSSEVETHHSRSLNIASRFSSLSQHTIATDAEYRSLPASPTLLQSNFSSPVHISDDTHQLIRSPLLQEGSSSPSPPTARPRLISFTPQNPISPQFNLSDLELESDFDVMSDQGSEGSGRSWAAVSAGSESF